MVLGGRLLDGTGAEHLDDFLVVMEGKSVEAYVTGGRVQVEGGSLRW